MNMMVFIFDDDDENDDDDDDDTFEDSDGYMTDPSEERRQMMMMMIMSSDEQHTNLLSVYFAFHNIKTYIFMLNVFTQKLLHNGQIFCHYYTAHILCLIYSGSVLISMHCQIERAQSQIKPF